MSQTTEPLYKHTLQGRRINVAHPIFIDGYMTGSEHPGFRTATVPDPIPNKYAEGTDEHTVFAAGFRTAIE